MTMRIKDIGEFGLIDEIRKLILSGDGVVVGIGDDAAVLTSAREGMYDLLTTDMLVEGTHFDLSQATPYQLGWKALGCALSDIAAMAGVPRVAVVSLGIQGEASVDFCRELYSGMNEVGGRFGCGIVGGDTVGSSRGLVISVAVLGEVEIASLTLRSGAEPGDGLWVTGTLGGSLGGKHLSFMPRLEEAKFIVNRLRVKAMIDLSDGLAGDLHRLAEASNVGFRVKSELIPLDRETIGDVDERTALHKALYDGEDFELLFAAGSSGNAAEFREEFCSRFDCGIPLIGEAVSGSRGVSIVKGETEEPLREAGFSHFD